MVMNARNVKIIFTTKKILKNEKNGTLISKIVNMDMTIGVAKDAKMISILIRLIIYVTTII